MIDTMVMFVGAGDHGRSGKNGIKTAFNDKRYVTRDIDVDFTFPMNMQIKGIINGLRIGQNASDLKFKGFHRWKGKVVLLQSYHLLW